MTSAGLKSNSHGTVRTILFVSKQPWRGVPVAPRQAKGHSLRFQCWTFIEISGRSSCHFSDQTQAMQGAEVVSTWRQRELRLLALQADGQVDLDGGVLGTAQEELRFIGRRKFCQAVYVARTHLGRTEVDT